MTLGVGLDVKIVTKQGNRGEVLCCGVGQPTIIAIAAAMRIPAMFFMYPSPISIILLKEERT